MPENDLIGNKTKAVPVKPKEIGIDTDKNLISNIIDAAETSSLDMASIESFSTVAQTREEIYNLIDLMSQDDTISAILETYAEDSVESNDSGQIIWCESSNDKVAKYVTYLLDSLNVDKNAYNWIFNLIKYGDLYLKLYRESDYENDILFSDTRTGKQRKRRLDEKRKLDEDVKLNLRKSSDHFVHYVEAIANPGEMFELTKFGKTMGYIQAPASIQKNYNKSSILNSYLTYKMKPNDVNIYDATEFVHACLEDNSSRTPEEVNIFSTDEDLKKDTNVQSSYTVRRGQSLLSNSFKIWRELSLLENSVLLNRLTKSAIVRILNVDVGDMPKEQVNNFMTRLKEKIEQKSALGVGNSMTEYTNPGPIENILYVPTHGTQGNITAQSIGGDVDVKGLSDLDYFQNKLYGSLRVPKQFFAQTDDAAGFNGGSSLSIISSRYGKAIKRIQNTLCQAITDLINVFLLDKGLTSYINQFTIRMQSPITQEELDRRENMRNRIGVIGDIINQINDVVKDEVVKAKIVKVLLSNSIADPEVISLLQEQIDLLEEPKSKSPKKDDSNEEEIDAPKDIEANDDPIFGDSSNEFSSSEFLDDISSDVLSDESSEFIADADEDSYMPNADELGIDLTNNDEF